MYEYKTERVDPSNQQSAINMSAIFGWELMSAQETYNESTSIVGSSSTVTPSSGFKRDVNTSIWTNKNIVNYVTLQFRRDLDLPKNRQLIELEHQAMDNFPQEPRRPIPEDMPIKFTVISIIVMLVMTFILISTLNDIVIIIGFIIDLVLIVIIIVKWVKYRRDTISYHLFMRHYEDECEAYRREYNRRMEICEEARRIYYDLN